LPFAQMAQLAGGTQTGELGQFAGGACRRADAREPPFGAARCRRPINI
jgi:hypothetical protein